VCLQKLLEQTLKQVVWTIQLFALSSKTRQDKTRQDKTRQDKTRQDKTRQDKTRQDKTTVHSSIAQYCNTRLIILESIVNFAMSQSFLTSTPLEYVYLFHSHLTHLPLPASTLHVTSSSFPLHTQVLSAPKPSWTNRFLPTALFIPMLMPHLNSQVWYPLHHITDYQHELLTK
jgi:hypothetical protein